MDLKNKHQLKTENGQCPVSCQSVSKRYFRKTPFENVDVTALKDISFEVNRGEIFGIIGPDGAGKTTLFRILTTLILADSGQASVNGYDVVNDFVAIRNQVGYMPGRFSLYQDLTVEENLEVFARVFKTSIEENYHLVADIYQQLEPFKKRRAGKLSGGMKQKLALCCALIHKPSVLFLDEPTTGVDPVSRREFWEMLKRLKQEGISILVSTPYMDEATLCDRIALIREGRIMTIDTPDGIIGQYPDELRAVSSSSMSNLLYDLRRHPEVGSCYAFGDCHHVSRQRLKSSTDPGPDPESTFPDPSIGNKTQQLTGRLDFDVVMLDYLKEMGHENIVIKPIKPSIEDCFMALNRNTI